MSIPEGATHKLKYIHRNKPFYRYLKTIDGAYYSCDDDGKWKLDKSMRNMLEFYNEVK